MKTELNGSEWREIQNVIEASIGWALTKDKELLFRCMAQDNRFFIFHPGSKNTIVGFEPFRQLTERIWMNPAFQAKSFAVKNLRIDRSLSGSVAWFSALLDDNGEWNGKPTSWVDVRWTGVLEKRDERWLLAQMHFSQDADLATAS